MSEVSQLMQDVTITGRLRDGGTCEIKCTAIDARNLHLEGGLYHPFQHEGHWIMYIIENGNGESFISKKSNKGISLPAHIIGRKNLVGLCDNDPYNMCQSNFDYRMNRGK